MSFDKDAKAIQWWWFNGDATMSSTNGTRTSKQVLISKNSLFSVFYDDLISLKTCWLGISSPLNASQFLAGGHTCLLHATPTISNSHKSSQYFPLP